MTVASDSYMAAVDGGNCTVTVKKETYKYAQFHVHTPSEHTIDGKAFDGEIHFVHKKADGSGALVIGLFLKKTNEADTEPAVDAIVDAMSVATMNATIPMTLGSYSDLLGAYASRGQVFNYAVKMQSRGSPRHRLGQILQSLRNPDLVRSKGYVNGEWVEGRGGEYFAAVDPPNTVGKRSPHRLALSPWHFPYATVVRNLAPCVASGCAAVVKPSGKTPLSMVALARLAEIAGVPAGVINVVTAPQGSHSGIGKELTENPDVRLIAFTGSTRS
ncbi:hypothetical protein PC118_g18432 [Phytophthora cactorum]|uniref:Alpha-carbonic anhydrase domain-containing protein n=2 Tax=Phytophthora cactorum TaxID=29920 RepID=A0A8T1F8X1_9STRA|nr:hypothetical protein PC118_g18432 [Phytophthora cactorum]